MRFWGYEALLWWILELLRHFQCTTTPLIRGEEGTDKGEAPLTPLPPYQGETPCQGSFRGTLEPSRRSELLVNVYLFFSFTIICWYNEGYVGRDSYLDTDLPTQRKRFC